MSQADALTKKKIPKIDNLKSKGNYKMKKISYINMISRIIRLAVIRRSVVQTHLLICENKTFVGLRSCNNVQTERSISKYANRQRLQI